MEGSPFCKVGEERGTLNQPEDMEHSECMKSEDGEGVRGHGALAVPSEDEGSSGGSPGAHG